MDRADYYKYKVCLMRDEINNHDAYYVQEAKESIIDESQKGFAKILISKTEKFFGKKNKDRQWSNKYQKNN